MKKYQIDGMTFYTNKEFSDGMEISKLGYIAIGVFILVAIGITGFGDYTTQLILGY